jgi:UDP-N-acetylglucosamine 3-dehydrogenase
MAPFKVGIIGCGRPWRSEGATGFGQGHVHAAGYEASPDCEIVAAADIVQDNLDFFCEQHNVPHGYLDYKEMLAMEELDIVSVCLWPHLHAPAVIDVAQAVGANGRHVRAIYAEKPMAPTWGEARRMAAACEENGVVLAFNHQRRFGKPFRKAKELLDGGKIGELLRLEAFTSNLYDWGTHWFDMLFFYNDEEPVEWVIGQIDARGGHPIFGTMVEGQGLSFWRWRNGVYGLMVTGSKIVRQPASPLAGEGHEAREPLCGNRLIGAEGVIEVGVQGGPEIRFRNVETGYRWQDLDVGGRIHGNEHVIDAVQDLADALKTGREPELSARKALQATELIFATYESSRKRGRVDLPLEIEDSPFLSMLESGEMSVEE